LIHSSLQIAKKDQFFPLADLLIRAKRLLKSARFNESAFNNKGLEITGHILDTSILLFPTGD
jgi:hypothetical protein